MELARAGYLRPDYHFLRSGVGAVGTERPALQVSSLYDELKHRACRTLPESVQS